MCVSNTYMCVCVCHDTYVLNYKEHPHRLLSEKNFHSNATVWGLLDHFDCIVSTLKFVFRSIHIYNIWQQRDKQNKTEGK